MYPLRQSTAATVKIGPFVDATDAVTPEAGLATNGTEISKAGGEFAAGPALGAHDAEGWYPISLSTSHTDTVGPLTVKSQDAATHLPVWHEFTVLEEEVYDALYASGAAGYSTLDSGDVQSAAAAALTSYDAATATDVSTAQSNIISQGDTAWITATGFSTHDAAAVVAAMETDGSKLDHLWEMTEDDAGVRRLTANALEQAPGNDTVNITTEITNT